MTLTAEETVFPFQQHTFHRRARMHVMTMHFAQTSKLHAMENDIKLCLAASNVLSSSYLHILMYCFSYAAMDPTHARAFLDTLGMERPAITLMSVWTVSLC